MSLLLAASIAFDGGAQRFERQDDNDENDEEDPEHSARKHEVHGIPRHEQRRYVRNNLDDRLRNLTEHD